AHARATLALCAEALGLMEAIRALTVDYLRTRQQFGRPIGKFQVLQHRMADMLIEIEQARSAVVNLAGNVDGPDRDRHVAATKNLIGEVARLVVEESIQMHGGIGVTEEYDLGRFAKRLSMVDHRFGDTMHHLERFIELSR
ncbi:MAG: acyl-CoA dehydrogenase family protein, partial [Pseudomonadota bacterium]